MEVDRYVWWIERDIGKEKRLFESLGFNVEKSKLPEPRFKASYAPRIDVTADNAKAYLSPWHALLQKGEKMTERDILLQKTIFERYDHDTPMHMPIYPIMFALFAACFILYALR